MNELALFAGAGGGILGGQLAGFHTVCAVEIEAFPREVLLRRQRDGLLPLFPIWDDARTFDGRPWRGLVDVVTAGFPCQPFSSAGKNLGEADPRNGWPWTARILGEVRPRFALLENVPNLLAHEYFGRVLGDLAALGYGVQWDCVPASAVRAPHQRDRLWLLAYPEGIGHGQGGRPGDLPGAGARSQRSVRPLARRAGEGSKDLADPQGERLAEERGLRRAQPSERAARGGAKGPHPIGARRQGKLEARTAPPATDGPGDGGHRSWWAIEPDVGRVADGVADRVDRLAALGNGQVPGVVLDAWLHLNARRTALGGMK